MRASGLVPVASPDSATGRADLVLAATLLVDSLFRDVIREDHVGTIADLKVLADRNPARGDRRHLAQQCLGIDHDPIGDHRGHLGTQHAGGEERQLVRLAAELHGMPRVVPTQIPYHDVVSVGQQVDNLAFGFVAPLQSDDGCHCHDQTPAS